MKEPTSLQPCVFKVPLELPRSLEANREELQKVIHDAQVRALNFARQYGWEEHMEKSYFDRVKIFDDKDEFDRFILELLEITLEEALKNSSVEKADKLPKEFSAGLEKRVLFAVSPELFARNYPIGVEDKFYEKILAHEIAHRLHVRILGGNEDAMGPLWFFEGFAIYAAGQFKNKRLEMDIEEIWNITGSKIRGSYEGYNVVFRYFLEMAPLPELVKRAGTPGFIEWLKKLEKNPGRKITPPSEY